MADHLSSREVKRMLRGVVPKTPELAPSGCYVYRLHTKQRAFYVGKGTGFRAWDHFHSASVCISKALRGEAFEPSNAAMYEFMAQKLLAGERLSVCIVASGLSEAEALTLESKQVEKYGRLITGEGWLFNLADGGAGVGSGFMAARRAYRSGRSVYKDRAESVESFRARPTKLERRVSTSAFGPLPPISGRDQ